MAKNCIHNYFFCARIKIMKKYKKFVSLLAAYLGYLLVVPRLVASRVNCLMPFAHSPSEYHDCTVVLASNTYLQFAAVGWITVLILYLFLSKKFKLKRFVVFSLITAFMLVCSYYIYLPQAHKRILESDVYLDSVH